MRLPAAVPVFFIAGLLYLLRFERLDNLGAYRIPPETGSSHPIWFRKLSLPFLYLAFRWGLFLVCPRSGEIARGLRGFRAD